MEKGYLPQRVAARLSELGKDPVPAAVDVGLGRDFFRDLIEGRKESINGRSAPKAATALEWTVAELYGEKPVTGAHSRAKVTFVPILDFVAAGKLASPMSQIPLQNARKVGLSGLGRGDFFGLTVQGTSMDRVSPDGSIIIFNRLDRQLVKGKFYVFSVRGETTYKRWHAEPEYLEPYTTDIDAHGPIFVTRKRDLEVIGRVKRTILDL